MTSRRTIAVAAVTLLPVGPVQAQQDEFKDWPYFSAMPNYELVGSEDQGFDSHTFFDGHAVVTVEGTLYSKYYGPKEGTRQASEEGRAKSRRVLEPVQARPMASTGASFLLVAALVAPATEVNESHVVRRREVAVTATVTAGEHRPPVEWAGVKEESRVRSMTAAISRWGSVLAVAVLAGAAAAPAPHTADQAPERERAVTAVIDDWHAAAAAADEERYFGHMSEGAVFLGTDPTERWTKAQFRAYAHPYFVKGKAWSFRPVSRTVSVAPDGSVAWFDEELATPNLGPARGSGVLLRDGATWTIVQYNLSVPIPNAVFAQVKGIIASERTVVPPD